MKFKRIGTVREYVDGDLDIPLVTTGPCYVQNPEDKKAYQVAATLPLMGVDAVIISTSTGSHFYLGHQRSVYQPEH